MKQFIILLLILTAVQGYSQKKKNLYIADHLADCSGAGKQKCMLIKEKITDEWQTFYDQIEGFEYEEGYEYLIRVKVKRIKNPPADGSSERYILKKVFEKKQPERKGIADIHNTWKAIQVRGIDELSVQPTITFDDDGKRVTGKAGCNNYFGAYDSEKNELDFSKMGMTRKMCPENMMNIENVYINNLRKTVHYEMEGNQLFLYDENNELLITFEVVEN